MSKEINDSPEKQQQQAHKTANDIHLNKNRVENDLRNEKVDIDRVAKDYFAQVDAIKNDPNMSEEDKVKALTKLGQEVTEANNQFRESYEAEMYGMTLDEYREYQAYQEYKDAVYSDDNASRGKENLSQEEKDLMDEKCDDLYANDLEKNLYSFEQSNWEDLSLSEKKEAISNLRDSIAEDLGLAEKPEIRYYSGDANESGGYSRQENTIYINENTLTSGRDVADTIAHEARHCWQHERAENPQTEQDYKIKESLENYIAPSDDYRDYKRQECEVDARAYAASISSQILESIVDEKKEATAKHKEQKDSFSDLNPEKGTVFEKVKEDTDKQIELKPISQTALDKCKDAGLSEAKVDELRKMPHGEKPDPSTYLSEKYIENHLAKFESSGCYKIISDKRGEPQGTIGEEGVFVINGNDFEQILKEANGDPRKLEELLALKPGYLGENPYVIRCDEPHNLRMPTGNEPNAWVDEWCPAGVTRAGKDEAVIDPMKEGEYSYKHVFGDEEWKK